MDLGILLFCVWLDSSTAGQAGHYRGDFNGYLVIYAVLALVLLTMAGCASVAGSVGADGGPDGTGHLRWPLLGVGGL